MGVSYGQLLLHFNDRTIGHVNGAPKINIDFWRLKTNDR